MLPITTLPHDDPTAPATPFFPIRALLLDDNRFDQRRIERMARDSGMMITFDIAPDLTSMAALLEMRDFDVALLDYRLPVGSGNDALDLLRNSQSNQECPTIMVAGDDILDDIAQNMRDACDSFISKDRLSPDILRAAVNTILNQRVLDRLEDRASQTPDLPQWQIEVEANIEGLIREIRHLKTMRDMEKTNLATSLSRLERRTIRLWSDIRNKGAALIGQEAKFDILAGLPKPPGRPH